MKKQIGIKIEQPYNATEIGMSQTELKKRHAAQRAEFLKTSCQKCKHKKHDRHICYVMMGESGSPHQVCCACDSR